MLTHSCSLGYNGAVLQALAVHLSLQGALDLPQQFISRLIEEMEEVEANEETRNDARMSVPQESLYLLCYPLKMLLLSRSFSLSLKKLKSLSFL